MPDTKRQFTLPPIHPFEVFKDEGVFPLPTGYTIHAYEQFFEVWGDVLEVDREFLDSYLVCDEHPLPVRLDSVQHVLQVVTRDQQGRRAVPLKMALVSTFNTDEPDCDCCGAHGAVVTMARGGGEYLFSSSEDEGWNTFAAHVLICHEILAWLRMGLTVSVEAL